MALTIVQIFLTLLLAAHVCMCTKQDLSRISAAALTNVRDLALTELRTVFYSQPEVARSQPADNEEARGKRAVGTIQRMDVTDKINSLRSYAGASDMNYLTHSNSFENDAANWTSYCDYDATFYENSLGFAIRSFSANQPNYVSVLETVFNSSDFYYALRSVELRSVGAAYSFCSRAIANGQLYANVYLSAYAFSNTSKFSTSVQQYTLGEACTTCRSGRFFCYQGLCKDDCSASDPNCDCNSYCLNCANTSKTTCSCQCVEGWTGSRCETAHVCMCTKQDLSGMSVGVVRHIDNLNKPNFSSDVRDLEDDGTKRERSITYTYRIDITDTINSLRSNVGASDMNYLTKSSSIEENASNWTSHCDYDADIYSSTTEPVYAIIFYTVNPPDYISSLSTVFNQSNFYYALRSVELRSVGAAYSYCSNAIIGGQDYTFYYIGAYFFSYTSNFNSKAQQYTLGEACTTCRSGSYLCYQGGLCKDDCSASDSNCYCNSYCLNCAITNSATCRCQCLEGWTDSRCNSSDGSNATEPTCLTTPRVPITWTTKGSTLTTTLHQTCGPTCTATKAPTTTNSGNYVVPIGKSMIQLSLYATLAALFLRL